MRVTRTGRRLAASCAVALSSMPVVAAADGFVIDKVYHPYVQPLEREFEYRTVYLDDSAADIGGSQVHKLGFGRSLSERWFGELYAIGTNLPGDGFEWEAWEAELKWQLTEQGEYRADWGLLFEFESERDDDVRELSATLLSATEFGRWTATLNLGALYEWGDDIANEWESELAAQLRYRWRPGFEPALELYSGDFAKGLGPVAVGDVRFGPGRRLHWEAGLIVGINSDSPDRALRFLLEYEF